MSEPAASLVRAESRDATVAGLNVARVGDEVCQLT